MATSNRRVLMYRDGGLPATKPLHLSVRYGTDVCLYLSNRGKWSTADETVVALEDKLRKWGFNVEATQYSTTVYGTHDAICVRLQVSDQRDEDRKLSDKQANTLRKLVAPHCRAEGAVAVTELYLAGEHLNTEVTITVTDGEVPYAWQRPKVIYPLKNTGGKTYRFFLAQPVGKEAEDPGRAATVVAEELGIYLPERIKRSDFKRQDVIIPPFDHLPYGDPQSPNFM